MIRMKWEPGQPLPKYHYRFSRPVPDESGKLIHFVEFIELPSCFAQGETPEEAAAALWQALERILPQMRKAGVDVPDPLPVGAVHVGAVLLHGVELPQESVDSTPNAAAQGAILHQEFEDEQTGSIPLAGVA